MAVMKSIFLEKLTGVPPAVAAACAYPQAQTFQALAYLRRGPL
jgi:hypothetical protein